MEGYESGRAWENYFGSRLSPKVVSVPVRFVADDRRRSGAAATIQKVFRAFAARKSVKKILAVKREVDGVERTISSPKTAKILRRDEKERLRLNETLMSLLLRLDSVRGVYSGVRECRKLVIRKAIALQERIDAIANAAESESIEAEAGPRPDPIDSPKETDKTEADSERVMEVATKRDSDRRLMERMLEENEKLMGMMSELHDRSAAQTRALSSLSQRIQQLERAFVRDKLSAKKKKKQRRLVI